MKIGVIGAVLGLLASLLLAGCFQDAQVKKQQHFERGSRYLADGKYNEAIVELKNALQIDSKFVPALHALGRAYYAKGWYPDAVRELSRASDGDPGSIEIRLLLGQAYLAAGDTARAEELAEAIRRIEPDNTLVDYLIGAARIGTGDPKEAVALLARAQAKVGNIAEIHQAYGDALFQARQFGEAEKAYRAALGLKGGLTGAQIGLARTLLMRGQREEATKLLGDARRQSPENPQVRVVHSAILSTEGRVDEAIKELEGLPPSARSPQAVISLADLYARADRLDESIMLLTKLN